METRADQRIKNMCRANLGGFDDADVPHVEQEVDPVRDLQIIRDELLQKDVETVEARHNALTIQVDRGIAKEKKAELEVVTKVLNFLKEEKKEIRFGTWTLADVSHTPFFFLFFFSFTFLVTHGNSSWCCRLKFSTQCNC